MGSKTWMESPRGEERLNKIRDTIRESKDRKEFRKKVRILIETPLFRGLTLSAIWGKLYGEEEKRSELGKLWKALPRGRRNTLTLNWTDEMKQSFKKDWPVLPISEMREKYRDPKGGGEFTSSQFSFIGKELGVSRSLRGSASTKGAVGVGGEEGEKLTPEKKLIRQREARDITPEGFIAGLAELKPVSDLKIYWDIIQRQLEEKRVIRNTDLLPFAVRLKIEGARELLGNKRVKAKRNRNLRERILNSVRGILGKFVEWGALSRFTVGRPGLETHEEYICNLPRFYTPEELKKLIPDGEKSRVLNNLVGNYDSEVLIELVPDDVRILLFDLLSAKPKSLKVLSAELGAVIGGDLLDKVLEYFVDKEVVWETKKGYALSGLGREFGVDVQSIRTLDAIALENAAIIGEEKAVKLPASLEEVAEILEQDLRDKAVRPLDVTEYTRDERFRLMWLCEVLYGNQFTDENLLNWVLNGRVSPNITIASGLVQGTFTGYRVDKSRVLATKEGLNKIATQFHSAHLLNQKLEEITQGKVFNVLGDDEWDLAHSYAKLLQLAEGKVWSHGVSTRGLSSELKRRLNITEFYRKWQIQWEIIVPYQLRIGRSLWNADEVFAQIGVNKSEYRLIIEILVAKRNNFDYPKEYEQIVNIDALFAEAPQKRERIVTPDPLILRVGNREIQFVHNAAFSDITQYVDSLAPLEMTMRNLGARGENLPWIIADGQQERFYATYLQGHWIMNLPGLQNPLPSSRYRTKTFNTRILSSKSHRQNTFRKEPVTSGVVELEALEDGRIRFRLFNHAIKNVLESQKDELEVREIVALPTDLQHASITMYPEMEIKYLDHALYEREAGRCYENGDVLHGFHYPQHVAENRPNRLVSVDSQQRFTLSVQIPLIVDAPNLHDFLAWLGNHEWGIWGNSLTGTNALFPLEAYMRGYIDRAKKCGCEKCERFKNMRAMTVNRIRWTKTPNPRPDKVNWPFFTTEIAGFKMAITHMWQPHGGGRTPVDQQRRWLYNMATACGDIDIMFGGHKHSIWMAQVAEKWLIQMAAGAGQSGYALQRGLMDQVMFTLAEFSNRDGITIEFIPWQFLEEYKCQCPFYKGKDKELELPRPGTLEYKYGKNSPLIEHMIDEVTQYLDV